MKTQRRKHADIRSKRYHHSCAVLIIKCFTKPSSHIVYSSLKLKPLYKELLYTIAHKMGNSSSTEVFTDSQLHQYIKEVNISASEVNIPHNVASELMYDSLQPLQSRFLSFYLSYLPGLHYDRVRARQFDGESTEHRGENRKSACLFKSMRL